MEKSPRAGRLGALNPATEKIKTLDSHNVVLITGCSGGLFCLGGCLFEWRRVSHGRVPVLCVCTVRV